MPQASLPLKRSTGEERSYNWMTLGDGGECLTALDGVGRRSNGSASESEPPAPYTVNSQAAHPRRTRRGLTCYNGRTASSVTILVNQMGRFVTVGAPEQRVLQHLCNTTGCRSLLVRLQYSLLPPALLTCHVVGTLLRPMWPCVPLYL